MLTLHRALARPARDSDAAAGRAAVAALAIAAALVPLAPRAAVWKCAGAGAIPLYQDRPCPPGAELRDLEADPPTLSVLPFAARAEPPPRTPPRRAERTAERSRRGEKATPARGDAAERRFVREGMSEGEVLARLGPPDLASPKGGRKSRWTFLPAPGDPQTLTLVRFEDGHVVAVERRVVR